MNGRDSLDAVPLENFIQAITSQLDRAQTAMALKVRAGLPLTFAVRDLSLDLRTHVDMEGETVRIRPAGPGDRDASTLHIALTTITRPMMQENALQLAADPEEIGIQEVAGEDLSAEDLRRLEWAGIRTVSQLRQVTEETVERFANVPAMRLRAALQRAAQPLVREVTVHPRLGEAEPQPPLVRLRGRNLRGDHLPLVRMNGEDVPVVESGRHELVLAPLAHQMGGEVVIEPAPGEQCRVTVPAAPGAGRSTGAGPSTGQSGRLAGPAAEPSRGESR
jgi:hypothetical protein